jgi:hypothetical protein
MPVTSVPLVDVHAAGVGPARVSPHDGVVPDDPAGRVVQRAHDRVPRAGRGIQVRHQPLDLGGADHLGLHALQLVDLGTPAHRAQRRIAVRERQVPAPGEHDVEVQVGRQAAVLERS